MDDGPSDFDGLEWDAAKSEATFAARAVDFSMAARMFEGGYIEREDLRQPYGERRYVVTGEVDDLILTIVWTPRGRPDPDNRLDATGPIPPHHRGVAGV